jgi:MFS family permease
MSSQPTGLWLNADFLKLWTGQTISVLGSQVTFLALPLTAVLTLNATPIQMGLLRATHAASAVAFGLFAGVLIDRLRRRPILIGTDLGFAAVAASVPIAAVLGLLSIEQLFAVQLVSGILSISSDVAHMSFLPAVIDREHLVEGNSKLQATASAASVAGPGIAGALVQAITAPMAMFFDAVSFVLSAWFVWLIRTPEMPPAGGFGAGGFLADLREGLRAVYQHPVLRPMAESIAAYFLFSSFVSSMFVIYAIRDLRITPSVLGVVFSAVAAGFLAGALVARRAAKRFGPGPAMTAASLLTAVAFTLIPLATGSAAAVALTLIAAHFVLGFGIQVNGINLLSTRQAITPDRLLGRVNATFRWGNLCAVTAGSLIASALVGPVGLRVTMAVGAAGLFLVPTRLFFSPIRLLREYPAQPH